MATQGIASENRKSGRMARFVAAAALAVALAVLGVQAASVWSAGSQSRLSGGVESDTLGVRPVVFDGAHRPSVTLEHVDPRSRPTLQQIEAKKNGHRP
jgi:hypothetical protein